jgi:hypothetical protein
MLVTEAFLRSLVKQYGRRTVYSDGGPWYPEASVRWDWNTGYIHHMKRVSLSA